jgi:molecular chaperone Hsp33
MKDRDSLHRFLFENLSVRGEVAHLDAAWQAILERRDYPAPVRRLLGEALAAAALLAATIKFDGLLTLQIQGNGPLRLMLVQCTSERTLRGLATWEGEVDEAPLSALCGEDGILTITIDPGPGQEPYQSVIALTGASLADVLEDYFGRSEQLPTRLQLAATEQQVAGLLLQRLPETAPDPDAWNRIEHLGATLTDPELLGLDVLSLLRCLFHEEDVRLFEGEPLSFRCTCSRERTANVLRSLGHDEIQEILEEQGRVGVKCEFCGMDYEFDPVDAEGLFAPTVQPEIPTTRH